MNTKPMIFTAEMVRAILRESNPKTQTRRVIMPQPQCTPDYVENRYTWIKKHVSFSLGNEEDVKSVCSQPGFALCEVGDILWVREMWRLQPREYDHETAEYSDFAYQYRADFTDEENGCYGRRGGLAPWKWKSSRFMPKAAARIFLRVTDVRVGRLQDISAEDCRAEGINVTVRNFDDFPYGEHSNLTEKFVGTESGEFSNQSAWYKEWFSELWDFLNKKRDGGAYMWDKNPWVWIIEFERAEKPIGWCEL